MAGVHDVHHPIDSSLYYEEQKTEALRKAEAFPTRRLPIGNGLFRHYPELDAR